MMMMLMMMLMMMMMMMMLLMMMMMKQLTSMSIRLSPSMTAFSSTRGTGEAKPKRLQYALSASSR